MNHSQQIMVNCWKCNKPFDIVSAKRCYSHLNGEGFDPKTIPYWERDDGYRWTTKCSHCGACMCHKYDKMKDTNCEVLNEAGIMRVMPSVHKKLSKQQSESKVDSQ